MAAYGGCGSFAAVGSVGQLLGMLAAVCAVAATVAGAGWLVIDEAERRFCDLVSRRRPCSQRMILPSSRGSCAPLPQAFTTLEGCILAY